VIKAAFRCDLTRVVTFQWAPGNNHVSFGGLWPPDPTSFEVHHTTSHDAASEDLTEFSTRVEEFYALRVASFLRDLAAEPRPAGAARCSTTRSSPTSSRSHLWMATAEAFGMPGFVLGDADMHTTPIRGLFA
jgi:hypothetical protein